MPDHVMNYVECDAEEQTLAQWRRSRSSAAAKRRFRLHLRALARRSA